MLGAALGKKRIAVEAKSFRSLSPMRDFELALGQYLIYAALLEQVDPERSVYLAITQETFDDFFQQKGVQYLVAHYSIALVVINLERTEVVRWTS